MAFIAKINVMLIVNGFPAKHIKLFMNVLLIICNFDFV